MKKVDWECYHVKSGPFAGKFPWKKVLHYMLAQFLGAFAGAAVVYGVYFEALREVEDKFFDGERLVNATAGIFATYPQPHLSIGGGFIDQVPSETKFIGLRAAAN